MKAVLTMIGIAVLAACVPLPSQPVDAAAVTQGGAQLTSAFGAKITGRDWNAQPSEALGNQGDTEAGADK